MTVDAFQQAWYFSPSSDTLASGYNSLLDRILKSASKNLPGMKVGIVGGGPSGLCTATRLANSGISVTVFDHKIPFAKPCGGGLTAKIFRDFPELSYLKAESRHVGQFRFRSRSGRVAEVDSEGIWIICRRKMSELMLAQALRAGVRHEPSRVKRVSPTTVECGESSHQFDVVIGADGAHGVARRDLSKTSYERWGALGYYIEGLVPDAVDISFDTEGPGYLWVFPRPDHASVGIAGLKGSLSKDRAEERITSYLNRWYPGFTLQSENFYSATIPLPRATELADIAGPSWMLIGDSAGLADPITGEGIYYALASAMAAAEAVVARNLDCYQHKLAMAVLPEILKAGRIFDTFYSPWFTRSMVRLGACSPAIAGILGDLVSGRQGYQGLKRRLVSSSALVLRDVVVRSLSGHYRRHDATIDGAAGGRRT